MTTETATSKPDEWTPLTCILPGCTAELNLSWAMSMPLFYGELPASSDPAQPNDASAGAWKVECNEGHVILIPDYSNCERGNDCDDDCDHDASDDLRTWRRSDVERLAALLGIAPTR